ncbi:MAG TPA: 3-oxoacyl-ACP reductase family protein [Armatimonadota bacterium]|nr:3-oxoacyl-ACP reductase family protein [Armatimonadota bacterium]
MRLKDKVAIVTGGSRGIGRAIALGMAREGAKVVVNYVANDAAANEVVEMIRKSGGEAMAFKAHVASKPAVEAMAKAVVDKYGRIDILVNNAGVAAFIDFFETTEEAWDWHQNTNCKGIFLASQAVAREMVKTGGGRIINVTSISGEKATNPLQVAYCTSKGGANMLSKVMALALAPYNITVNAVLPGTIETDINRDVLADPKARNAIIENTPLKCLGEPEDIVGAVMLLASDESKWTTGTFIVVDGGFIL